MKVSVAKLLQYKNRLAGKIAEIERNVKTHNSVNKNSPKEIDVRQQYERLLELKNNLVATKMALYKSNVEIQHLVFRMAEIKGTAAFLKEVPTTRGEVSSGYRSDSKVEMVAEVTKAEIDKAVAEFEEKIDEIQQQLDKHNHTTEVEVTLLKL